LREVFEAVITMMVRLRAVRYEIQKELAKSERGVWGVISRRFRTSLDSW